ncbi:hypothetical protein BG011_007114 [Mortierella polycephala]|uniref:Secreted lipase n=1 Tax=Mortierella polycephala TaxID=41804 RepID=A0A9P6PRT8_9FUNG|nr:hypothetical protein BG011_007114 [Mortierella polycephala]
MKFTISSVLSAAASAILLTLSAVPATALPTSNAPSASLEKRAVDGLNNFGCKLTAEHPRPVIMVHGTVLNIDSWSTFAPVLIKQGYCVFALTYGKYKNTPIMGGLAPIEDSAQELSDFANNILERMNVTQVDIVGHSQGGILARYWIKYLDGAGKVYRHVGISAINHGTTLSGITVFAKALGIFTPSQPLFDAIAPSLFQMVDTSEFMAKLNAGGDTAPGVIHSNIVTKYDEIVTPYENCYQNGPNVVNALLQKNCMLSLNEHLTMVNSKVVLQFVLNQLDPSTAKTANCLSML